MSTQLTIIEPSTYAIAQTSNAGAILADVLNPGETLSIGDLPRIKVPAGGSLNWELPSGDAAKELQCIILHRQLVRAYWAASFDSSGGGTPPDCSSRDNVNGEGIYGLMNGVPSNSNPTGECEKCPMNQWGSAIDAKGQPAGGKGCRQITRLFLMFPDSVLPTILSLPPSSLKPAQQYVVNMASKGVPYYGAVTGIALMKAKSDGGIDYSQAIFRQVGDIDPETAQRIAAYRTAILPSLTGLSVEA